MVMVIKILKERNILKFHPLSSIRRLSFKFKMNIAVVTTAGKLLTKEREKKIIRPVKQKASFETK